MINSNGQGRAFLIKCLANKQVISVAREIGVRPDQMAEWVKGTHKIYPKIARKLGRYFHVGPENFLDQWYDIPKPISKGGPKGDSGSEDVSGEGFGNELKRWRLRMGLSMTDLAVRLGYCEKTICNWERGYNLTKEKQDAIRMLFESVESNLPEIF